jgi:hypothetical protein
MVSKLENRACTFAQLCRFLTLEGIVGVDLLLLVHHARAALEKEVQKIAGLLVVLLRKPVGTFKGLVQELFFERKREKKVRHVLRTGR